MSIRSRLARIFVSCAVLAGSFGGIRAVTEPPPDPIRLGLYEWMGTAPLVVAADVISDDGRFVVAVVRTPVKGDLPAGKAFQIDHRQANKEREMGTRALDLTKGRLYLFLLGPSTRGKDQPHSVYRLERGVGGARELPAEGAEATVDAAVRLGAIQERKSDEYVWETLPSLLEEVNPVLVDSVLEMYVKFRRESVDLLPVLTPLLEHPRPDFRRRAALLIGRIVARAGESAIPERSGLVAELMGRARRDEDATVRREATIALSKLPDVGVEETLRAIAKDDPDQDVRFEAEKSVYERKLGARGARSD